MRVSTHGYERIEQPGGIMVFHNRRAVFLLHKHPCNAGESKADYNTAYRRNQKRHDGPLKAAGFLTYGKQSGGAGPVHQGEKHGADSGDPGPPISHQQLLKLGQAVEFQNTALGHVSHDDDGDHDLVGRKSKDKGHEDNTIHA